MIYILSGFSALGKSHFINQLDNVYVLDSPFTKLKTDKSFKQKLYSYYKAHILDSSNSLFEQYIEQIKLKVLKLIPKHRLKLIESELDSQFEYIKLYAAFVNEHVRNKANKVPAIVINRGVEDYLAYTCLYTGVSPIKLPDLLKQFIQLWYTNVLGTNNLQNLYVIHFDSKSVVEGYFASYWKLISQTKKRAAVFAKVNQLRGNLNVKATVLEFETYLTQLLDIANAIAHPIVIKAIVPANMSSLFEAYTKRNQMLAKVIMQMI